MEFIELGQTGVMVPEIGLGMWAYTGGEGPIHRGIQLGAFFLDTAENYGTELVVGNAIKGRRDSVFVATKVSPTHFRRGDLQNAADQSLKQLSIDYIDLYQLHWPNPSVPIEETMDAMESLVEAGKVRFIGVSNFSVAQMQQAQTALRKCKVVSNQVKYNLICRGIEGELIPFCQDNQVTVIAYSPLSEGLHRILQRDSGGIIEKISHETGKTSAQIVLNWCTRRRGVIAIPKSNRVERVEENCGASGWRLSSAQIEALDQVS